MLCQSQCARKISPASSEAPSEDAAAQLCSFRDLGQARKATNSSGKLSQATYTCLPEFRDSAEHPVYNAATLPQDAALHQRFSPLCLLPTLL